MANLKEVRNRIASVSSTQQITKAMKMVSAAKLKRATDSIVQLRPYAEKLKEILGNLSSSIEGNASPFLEIRTPKKVLVVIVTSNKGLAGAFNTNAIKTAGRLIQERYSEQVARSNVSILAIGKKGHDHFSRLGYPLVGEHHELYNHLDFEHVSELTQSIMDAFVAETYDRVEVVYTQFKNAAVQILKTEQLLPVQGEAEVENSVEIDYIMEPSKTEIVRDLIPKNIKIQLYKAVLDSYASEHGARMTAMDKATENAGELLKSLRLSYNQARQAAITTELTEIVSGAAALSQG